MTNETDDFYVGYLPTPPALRRWVIRIVAVAVIACTAVVAVIATGQRDPGPGVWKIDDVQTFNGELAADPYLMLVEDDGRSLLLTGPTKEGADAWTDGLMGQRVAIRGHAITRAELRLVSMAEEPRPITLSQSLRMSGTASQGRSEDQTMRTLARPGHAPGVDDSVTLAGEIIDPKCYAGAMKPGDGKAHKACAALCIRGGIPPVLATSSPGAAARFLVIVDRDGGRLTGDRLTEILPLVAEPVFVTGREYQRYGLTFLHVEKVERRP